MLDECTPMQLINIFLIKKGHFTYFELTLPNKAKMDEIAKNWSNLTKTISSKNDPLLLEECSLSK
jgi:hypothetical protein